MKITMPEVDRYGRVTTDQEYIAADPTILRTRTCRYLLGLVSKCLRVHDNIMAKKVTNTKSTKSVAIEKIRSEVSDINRLIKKEMKRHPSTRYKL